MGMVRVNEDQLMRISLIGSVLGLFALFIVVNSITPVDMKIASITGNVIGNIVKVEGEINDIHMHKDGHVFFNLKDDTKKIKVVIWDNVYEQLQLSGMNVSKLMNGARVEITGTIERYKGELELIPLRSQVRILE